MSHWPFVVPNTKPCKGVRAGAQGNALGYAGNYQFWQLVIFAPGHPKILARSPGQRPGLRL